MKRSRYAYRLICCFLILLLYAPKSGHAQEKVHEVLILNSYHAGFEWSDSIVQGIRGAFAASDLTIDVTIEYMDTKKHAPADVVPRLKALYQQKYQDTRFDVIITSDNNALDFLLQYRDQLFPGVPIVFCGINQFDDAMIAGQPEITGVVEAIDIAGTLDLALRLHPGTRHVAAISDATPTDAANRARLAQVEPAFEETLAFIDLAGLSAPALERRLAELPDDTVILFFNLYRDEQGGTFTLAEGIALVTEHSRAPAYTLWEDKVQHGLLGGIIISGEAQGRHAAEMALRILRGAAPASIPILRESPNVPMFNYQQVRRFGIARAALPDGYRLLNEPDTFWYRYRRYVFGALILISVQLFIIVALGINVVERQRAGKALRESEAQFRSYIDHAPNGIFIADEQGRYLDVNPAASTITGYTVDELLQMHVAELLPPQARSLGGQHFRQVLEQGEASGELPLRHKDGSLRHWSVDAVRLSPNRLMGFVQDVTDRKRAEEALEKRILALTMPLDDAEQVSFEILFNLEDIQRLQDEFATATGVASIITRPDGTPITQPSNFCRLCSDVIRQTEAGRANCYQSDAIIGRLSPEGPTIQPCMSGGLWDAGAAITVGGEHVANWLIGQVRDDTQTEEKIRAYAREIRADAAEAVAAFREVPAMSREQFGRVAQALHTLANQLSNIAYQNVQQARFIAELERVETRLKQALAERTTLLEELYHRTKNNMQVICALIELQADYVNDEQARSALIETESRIQSMALVHQMLYQSQDLSRINLKEYIHDLVSLLIQSYQVSPQTIDVTFAMDDVFVLIDTAIPCGLILNEWISNALKHAFPGTQRGTIQVRLRRDEDDIIEITVIDDGVGLPADFDVRNDGRLGLDNVFALGEGQLHGHIDVQGDDGVTWRLRFKDNLYQPRV